VALPTGWAAPGGTPSEAGRSLAVLPSRATPNRRHPFVFSGLFLNVLIERVWRSNVRFNPAESRLEQGRVMLVAGNSWWPRVSFRRYYDLQIPSSGPKCNTAETEPVAGLSSGSSSGWQHRSAPLAFYKAHRREHAWRAEYSFQRRNRGCAVLWSAVRCWWWFVRWLDSCIGCPEHREASRRCASRRLR